MIKIVERFEDIYARVMCFIVPLAHRVIIT